MRILLKKLAAKACFIFKVAGTDFHHLYFMVEYNHSLSANTTITVSQICLDVSEQHMVNISTQ